MRWLARWTDRLRWGRAAPPPAPPPTFFYFRTFIALLFAQHVFQQYIRVRRRWRLARRAVPLAVRTALPQVDESAYLRAQQYASAKNSFGFFSDLYLLLCEVALLFAAPAVWNGPALNMTVNGLGLTPAHELARMWCSLLLMSPLEILIKVRPTHYMALLGLA
mgnify:CR=1 FL=1